MPIPGEYSRVASNFVFLSVLQAANYLLPLIIIPYLVRVIGIDLFGLLSFATATIMFLYIITEYGFNLTATRAISVNRGDREKLTEVYSSVLTVKFLLMLLSLLLLTLAILVIPKLAEDPRIYYLTFGLVIGQMMFPVWFFQGMENMGYITVINVVTKSAFTLAVFLLVNEPADYVLVPALTSAGAICAGGWSLFLVRHRYRVSFRMQPVVHVVNMFREGWYVFLSSLYTTVYTVAMTFFLGIFTSNTVVGYYSIAEKVVKGVGYLFVPLNDAVFPHVSKLVNEARESAVKLLNRLITISASIMSLLSVMLLVFADDIMLLVAGEQNESAVTILRILCLHPLVLTVSRIFANNYLVNFQLQHLLARIYMYASLLSLVVIFSLIPAWQGIGAAVGVMLIEVFVIIFMYYEIRKNIIRPVFSDG